MNLYLRCELAEGYRGARQKARVLTEDWFKRVIFCPNCISNCVTSFPNNKRVADFYCSECSEEFELKSSRYFGDKIVDGSDSAMCERILSSSPQSFCFLRYSSTTWEVTDFFVIPSFFFTLEVIEKRKPLSATARRAGWTGCNILLNRIPAAGKLFYVHDRVVTPVSKIRSRWSRMLPLKSETLSNKGWLLQVLKCVEEMPEEFSLADIYAYENRLRRVYPENNNIQPKIRQQLQRLREKGYIKFLGNGNYLRCDHINGPE